MASAQHSCISDRIRWGRLLVGFVITIILSLSVHAIMLQILHVPYPVQEVKTWIPYRFVTALPLVWGALWLYGCMRKRLKRYGKIPGAGILFILISGLNETLRGWFMNAYCAEPFMKGVLFSGIITMIGTSSYLSTSALIALGWCNGQPQWKKFLGSLLLTLLLVFVIPPLVSVVQSAAANQLKWLEPTSGWCVLPYGTNVLVPAYLSFIEPATATLFCALICWRYLPGAFWTKAIIFTALILALKQQLLATFAYAFYSKLPFFTAVVSMGQFSLEAAVLGFLTAVSWYWSTCARHREN